MENQIVFDQNASPLCRRPYVYNMTDLIIISISLTCAVLFFARRSFVYAILATMVAVYLMAPAFVDKAALSWLSFAADSGNSEIMAVALVVFVVVMLLAKRHNSN